MTLVAVTTVDRSPRRNFVEQTLVSLFDGDPSVTERCGRVRLVVDGDDAGYLGPWATDPHVAVELLSDDEMRTRPMVVQERCALSTWRAMAGARPGEPFILLQDDIVFAPQWLTRLERAADAVRADLGTESFVLAAYACYDFDPGPRYSVYPKHLFYANQALYFSSKAARRMTAYLYQHGVVERMGADDLIFRSYFLDNPIVLVATVPSLVQHVGFDTTGLSPEMHQSPTFRNTDEQPQPQAPVEAVAGVAEASMEEVLAKLGECE